ncbi:proline-specific permease ProY [Streptomyces cinnamoneus]|uniref:Proline-specific permease ProY n=1 Tax=Streptomyces cinnamoneus TaxID=53446 RepID=A0A2G1X9T1_STRCJ|nr:amino acid permease [Streptomyces cinnamoneus]PHQ47929.1 proline-specific permease ProY [Streptomyces cinnamoneus]PPT15554.1 amino acid permease [Streptomyces cinnamoneus]
MTPPETAPTEGGYKRSLGTRQTQMIAIGGTIGTGLFLGAGTAISQAGPSLILWYAVAGAVLFLVVRALGELLMYRPASGSFADYAREFLGPFWGYATAWTYWIMWVTTGMAEITAAGTFVRYWAPDFAQWKTALIALVVLTCANLISVKIFGELEFWFAMIKVTAILGMILIGVGVLILGFGDAGDTASVSHLWADGGIAPHGVGDSLMTLQIVLFAYLGVELVGVTAGETKDPEKNIPRAINSLPLRFALFYLGALVVILSVVSWSEFRPGTSPFVAAFAKIGIPAAAGIVNFVVLTSALSSCNAGGLYATARMLRTVGLNGDGPKALARLTGRGVPRTAVAVSAVVMAAGVGINALDPEHAFTYITSVSTGGAILVWSIILVTHMRYRRAATAGQVPASPYRMPGAPYTNWLALASFAFVTVLIGWERETRVALYVMGVWVALLAVGWAALRGRGKVAGGAATRPAPVVKPEERTSSR